MSVEQAKKTQTPAEIIKVYTDAAGECPVIVGQPIPAGSDDAIQVLQRALTFARDDGNWLLAAQLSSTLGLIYFDRANLYDARERTSEAVSFLRHADNKEQLARTLGNLSTITYYAGESDTALEAAREAAKLAGEAGLTLLQGFLLCNVGAVLSYRGEYRAGSESFEQAHQIFMREEDDLGMAWWQSNKAREQDRDQGRCAEAIEQIKTALPTLREKTTPKVVIENLLALADSYLCVGDQIHATEIVQEADALIAEKKLYWYRAESCLLKARFAFAQDDLKQASRLAHMGLGLVGDQGDLRTLSALYRMVSLIHERDKTRREDTQDALDRAIAVGRSRSRRLELALSLRQAGLHLKAFGNRPLLRARSSGFLFESERMFKEMDLSIPSVIPQPQSAPKDPTQK
ncbi:MAG TPA: hypothetical protein VKQ72_01500 [Aggregatilineales bacterium]|nr:hypothetical protein [Aggregatilineales bacterium]